MSIPGQRIRLGRRPDFLALHRQHPQRYPFLLESAVSGTPQARYDILFGYSGEYLELAADGELRGRRGRREGFLTNLDDWWSDLAAHDGGDLPFHGGWFLFLSYELAGEVEPTLKLPPAQTVLPAALAARCPVALIHDHKSDETWAIGETGAESLLDRLLSDAASQAGDGGRAGSASVPGRSREEEPGRYQQALARIHEYILSGDVFQVNLSRQWELPGSADPVRLYRALREANPAPFAGLARWGEGAVVSSSPERLVEVRDEWIQTRPIAGTRPRAPDEREDIALRAELIGHPKERAEHVMLIDLERNDIGRVCEPGTVEVNELMVVESYAHVHHIVSNVRGRLRPGIRPGQAIRAVFPGGTITGCPKVRCMEIIAELEGVGRGAYTGSMGYLNRDGSMDLNILIRTVVCERDRVVFRAGAGIVADSNYERELEETRSKAKGLLMALAPDSHKAGVGP